MSAWSERETADGSWTLWNEGLGEGCHSRSGAWQQATERYARPCLAPDATPPSRVWRLLDVGTGLGLNLAAALAELEPRGDALRALSLELDPSVIEAGLALYEREEARAGPWERWHAPVRDALRAALGSPGVVVPLGARGQLELRLGDARATLEHGPSVGPEFDAVFLDPFSPSRAPELWSEPFLARIATHMSARALLATYSAAFRVRLALVRAGLHVGRGARVGAKGEGTLARKDGDLPALAPRLARRLARRAMPSAHP